MKEVFLVAVMGGKEPFDSAHAEREIQRLHSEPLHVQWSAPSGELLNLTLPPTVYPPREDTDLLLSVLNEQRVNPKASWLEIGCGSGVLSWWAAMQGCAVSACDVNPLAVACTRALFSRHDLRADVHEGGPGPSIDGELHQWGGDQLYDIVVWNMPYLSADVLEGGALGPMEEAALTDTDSAGLLSRFLKLVSSGRLLTSQGVAFLTVSSNGVGQDAEAMAWSHRLAGRIVASTTFEDGEVLQVLAVWRPYAGAPATNVPLTESTNDDVFSSASQVGATVMAGRQTSGRGRHGRSWESQPEALMASWLVGDGTSSAHRTIDQLRVGEGLVRLVGALSNRASNAAFLKWPNDLWIQTEEGRLSKAGGVLFEAVTQGSRTRTVLGVGLNTAVVQGNEWGSIGNVGVHTTPYDLHKTVHAMVASLFESVMGLPSPVDDFDRLSSAVLHGSQQFDELFYRNKPAEILGLSPSGALILKGEGEPVDDPESIQWSVVQDSVEHIP